jgi:hypothetical protein
MKSSDEATARWCFDRLADTGEPGWLHSHRDQWRTSGQPWYAHLDAWARRENLYNSHTIVQALQARFRTRLLTHTPYFFPDLHPAAAETDEQEAIDASCIQATGIHYVASRPATLRP